MKSIHALSLSPAVIDWLANSRYPRILHIFDSACNLLNERCEVLSIVTPQIGNGPFNLVTEEVLFSEHVDFQSLVSNSPQPTLGNIIIQTVDAAFWDPCPNWDKLHARKDDLFTRLTELSTARYRETFCDTQVPIAPFSNSLALSLASADLPSSLDAAKQLAGLGSGLTPAGDDFIMGALYATWIIHPYDVASMLAREIANATVPLTTSLSAAWLRSAGKGEAGMLWHEFFDALTGADVVHIQRAMDKILAIGETSGADALAGFIDIFTVYAEREKDHVIPKHLYR